MVKRVLYGVVGSLVVMMRVVRLQDDVGFLLLAIHSHFKFIIIKVVLINQDYLGEQNMDA